MAWSWPGLVRLRWFWLISLPSGCCFGFEDPPGRGLKKQNGDVPALSAGTSPLHTVPHLAVPHFTRATSRAPLPTFPHWPTSLFLGG